MADAVSSTVGTRVGNAPPPPDKAETAASVPPPKQPPKPEKVNEEPTRVTLNGREAQPNPADFNAKPVQQYQAVSAIR